MRIATWNLNTWINRKNGITNDQLWAWADENLAADVVVFTEAATPAPQSVLSSGWSVVHRPGGFPNRSNWGTLIASRHLRIDLLTSVGGSHRLDTAFPGSLTAATLSNGTNPPLCIVGLYLPYRKNASKEFVGHPTSDLVALKDDFAALVEEFGSNMIVAGDLNFPYDGVPQPLTRMGFVDPFHEAEPVTFRQDWNDDGLFTMDYIYLSENLRRRATRIEGGIDRFPTAFDVSDHAPLLIELDLD